MNSQLKGDVDLKNLNLLPVNPDNLWANVGDGVLLCKMINVCVPDTIDFRVVNVKPKKNAWEIAENQQLAINSAKSIGCSTVNVGQEDLVQGRPHIVLGLIWQIIKIGLLHDINLKQHPELVRLLQEGEELKDLLKLPAEQILLRWFNYHLKEAGSKRKVANFTSDIKDSECYTILLTRIAPNKECDMSPMKEGDLSNRAEAMLGQADKIQCRKFVKARDVVNGHPKLNLAFVANLFNNYPALEPVKKEDYDFASLMEFDSEGTREERAFKLWIQSMGFDCENLFDDVNDGLLLLKVYDKIQPGSVNWKKVDQKPKMRLHKIQNNNCAVEIANNLKFSTVNWSGEEITDGNKKLILGMVWQMMRHNIITMLKQIGGGHNVTEDDVLKWANTKVGAEPISGFKDSTLKTGVFLCKLCAAVSPRSCNMEFVKIPANTQEDATLNAKYAISVARKIGATVFMVWEDITEVKPKMIFTFVASLMHLSLVMQKTKQ